ncbi:MAG: arginine--tRNA ligase [Candidatus Tokpelaia sp.]|uniref:arginine--tRNA ligase n=1 Tax=Candidatus Tokpelaia sp. TaxID=2233777 RepID=UPI00123A8D62|nr:arginine--tRNA ligase [Candidatus Tokpelaia sp.]KAA6205591.1 MAG: arginine--tRNA ligase [Candidatus Tokpelaia sp.]KAA6207797.1 MAG: arginine--tRNA ligase [Candidatus Tokpelaia sp.]KAA6404711.1 arginine--tRNA ligase [Candidatus Tokpelaia sp.]
MNIFNLFESRLKEKIIKAGLRAKDGAPLDLDLVSIEAPRDASHGDIATNAAMVLAGQYGENPRNLAGRLVALLQDDKDIAAVNVAGPGFINIRLKESCWQALLGNILAAGRNYGRSDRGKKAKINVEYVSANPTGPLHVGHCRGAVVGDVLANLLHFAGFNTVKEYYVNDAGGQIDVLAQSVLLRYREALGEIIGAIPEGLYPGAYLVPVGRELAEIYGDSLLSRDKGEALALVKDYAVKAMLALIREDLRSLNIHHEKFFSERFLHKNDAAAIRAAIDDLTVRGYVYKGVLPPPKGKKTADWENREQTLFRSTAVGDDVDRALIKADGSYTYFAADIAYFKDKYDRGFKEMIYILGADHGGYVKRLQAVAKAVSGGKARLDALLCQLVRLYRNGEPARMSKRAGNFVTLRDVVEEVGSDAVRFMMLYRKADAPLDFDFAKVTEQSRDNPVFYVQYAHARCYSVLRQAAGQIGVTGLTRENWPAAALERLNDESELALIRKMAAYPRLIEAAALAREPHRLAFYLYELAADFHAHWNKGNDTVSLRFIQPQDQALTIARLALVQAVADVLAGGLMLMGVSAPQEM